MRIGFARVGAVIALALASLVACGTGSGSANTAAAPASSVSNLEPVTSSMDVTTSTSAAAVHWPQLAGGTYLSTSVTGFELEPGTIVTIEFDRSGRLTAQAGCNSLSATATVTGGRLSSGPMSQTAMGCDAARMAQDAWLSDLLTSGPTLSVRGDQLVLASGATVITLQRKPAKAQAGAVTNTSNTSSAAAVPAGDFVSESTSGLGIPADVPVRLTFTYPHLLVHAACNYLGFGITIHDNRMITDGGGITDMACPAADKSQGSPMAWDQNLADFFSAPVTITLNSSDHLTLAANGKQIVLTRAAAGSNVNTDPSGRPSDKPTG